MVVEVELAEAGWASGAEQCCEDIAHLHRLPTSWNQLGLLAITEDLLNTLLIMLDLDHVDFRLNGAPSAFCRIGRAFETADDANALTAAVDCWLEAERLDAPAVISVGGIRLCAVALPLGRIDSLGTLVAVSRHAGFPDAADRLRLQTAINVASLALREIHARDGRLPLLSISKEPPQDDALAKSERELNLIINTIPAMAWSSTPDGMLDLCNQRLLDFVGLPAEAVLGHGFYRIFHPDDTKGLLEAWQEILVSKRDREVEGRIRGADGTYRWFMFRQNALHDADGNIVKWYGVIVEIEDRKRAEDALKAAQTALLASERNLRLIVDSLPVLVWSARPDGSADFVNQSWIDYAGVPADSLLDWGFLDFYHPDDIPGMVEIWEYDLEHSDSTHLEGRIRGADGDYRRFLFSGRKLTDANGVVRWFGCNVDIEALQRAQDALRERETALIVSEQRLNLIIKTMPAAIWSSTPDGMVDFFNQHFLDFVGLPHEEVAGLGFYRMFHPDDLKLMASTWERITATKQVEDVDGRIRRYDGEYRWFTLRQSPLLDAEGNVVKWYGIVLDIEDRKRAEEGLRRSQTELAHVTRVTTMGELAVSIAHEVNQPLMAIVTNAGTCLRWLDEGQFDLVLARQAAQRIVEDGHRAGDIVAGIRALARKSPFRMEAMDLQDALREVLLVLNGELRRRDVETTTEFPGDPLIVLGDRTQLQQVLLNLIMNGVEAMVDRNDGARRLTIRGGKDDEGLASIEVRDSGPGVKAGDLNKIFEAFFSTKQGGLGMGLSICRSIIEAHGGAIAVSNSPSDGSIFRFTVPMAEAGGNDERLR